MDLIIKNQIRVLIKFLKNNSNLVNLLTLLTNNKSNKKNSFKNNKFRQIGLLKL